MKRNRTTTCLRPNGCFCSRFSAPRSKAFPGVESGLGVGNDPAGELQIADKVTSAAMLAEFNDPLLRANAFVGLRLDISSTTLEIRDLLSHHQAQASFDIKPAKSCNVYIVMQSIQVR